MAREIYYLVESISTATAANQNFSGETHLHIVGKGNFTLVYDTPDGWRNCNLLSPYFVREYGYKRECDARRNWCFKHPENSKSWKTETRIIRAWVRKDGNIFIS